MWSYCFFGYCGTNSLVHLLISSYTAFSVLSSCWIPTLPSCLASEYFPYTAGDYHAAATLPSGDIPLISCGDVDNGIVSFVDVPPEHVYDHHLTIAFNGATLATKYHPYRFATKDDVALCEPRRPLRLSTEIFIQLMMNRERWRYSYYRKCYMEKLKRLRVPLPVKGSEIDEDAISSILEKNPYWQFVRTRLANTV